MNKKKLVIFGAGGFGREVMWQLSEWNKKNDTYEILGFVDGSSDLQGKVINGYPVIGNEDWLISYPEEICVMISIANARVRKKVVQKLSSNPNICFPNFVADDVKMSDSVVLGKGCIICYSNVLTVNITCGDFVIINLDCTVGHDAVIGDFVTLYPSVNISGNVTVQDGVEIGTGANLIQGKIIGESTVIGAGAVVVADLPPNCTAVGAPAKPIKFNS